MTAPVVRSAAYERVRLARVAAAAGVTELPRQPRADLAELDPDMAPVAVPERGAVARQDDAAAEIIALSLRYAEGVFRRHVEWPSQAALDTVLLWSVHASARDRDKEGAGPLIWRTSPRLLLTSEQNGSGKSTVLDLLAYLLGSRFGRLPKITGPGFAKLMGKFQEVALIDEARMVFGSGSRSVELQGSILAGYTKGVHALTGHAGDKPPDSLFGPVAYAGKDNLITEAGDSVMDLLARSLTVRLRRASRHYPEIDDVAEKAMRLAGQGMGTWAGLKRRDLTAAVARLSAEDCEAGELELSDVESGILRAAQIWRPLIAIADVIGGDWPQRARSACEELSMPSSASEHEEWAGQLGALDADLFGSDE